MGTDCPECGYWMSQGARFCARCGRTLDGGPVPTPASGGTSSDVRDGDFYKLCALVATLLVLAVTVVTVTYVATHLPGIFSGLTAFGMVIFPIGLVVYIASVMYAVHTFVRARNRESNGEPGRVTRCGATNIGVWVACALGLSYVYILTVVALGLNIDSSSFDKYTHEQMAAMLLLAGPEEEFIYRLLPIGGLMMIIALATRRRNPLGYLLGGFGTSRIAWVLIFGSAIIFGLAHLNGWNAVKVPQAALGGAIFGYVYVKYGLYASIVAHSTIDCLTIVGYVAPGLSGVIVLATLIIGVILFIYQVKYASTCKDDGTWLGEDPPASVKDRWERH